MVWEALLSNKAALGISNVVGSYLFGRVGDNLIDRSAMKRAVKRMLKDDRAFIEKSFTKLSYSQKEIEKIEEFLIDDIFQDIRFLYPVSSMPEDKKDILWASFCKKRKDAEWNFINENEDETLKLLLIECVDHHNKLINQYKLDDGEEIIIKTIEKNHSDLLGYIGQTMNSNSELQSEEAALDYSHKQLEGVLHALRMDLRHHKLLLLLTVIGTIIFSFLTVLVMPKIVQYIDWSEIERGTPERLYLLAIFLLVFIFAVLILLFISSLNDVRRREQGINRYTDALWKLNFEYYQQQLWKMSNQEDEPVNVSAHVVSE